MKFDVREGKKGEKDLILLVCTDGYEQVKFKDILTIVKHLYDNEDKIYPPPKFKGSKMLMEALVRLRTHTVRETLLEFKLRKREYLADFM